MHYELEWCFCLCGGILQQLSEIVFLSRCTAKPVLMYCKSVGAAMQSQKLQQFYFSYASSFMLREEALAQADILWRDLDQFIVVDEVQ
jgi:hypothetical protein